METPVVSAALATVLALAGLALALGRSAAAQDEGGGKAAPAADWPAPVKDFVPVQPGEHPRLLFRKAELPALKAKANTPEGQAILKRLRATLDGANGDTFPKVFNASTKAYAGNKTKTEDEGGEGGGGGNVTYTMSHAAGYGLLYQVTGEKKYADLGKEAFEKALEGTRDRDDRYSFRKPGGALRTGPSLACYAMGYDLCYDGWEPAYREKITKAFSSYDEGPNCSLESCARGKRQHPGSNHWGMEVGGAAMAVLAILKDPGCDMAKVGPLVEDSSACMIRNMTQGFGDGGFFPEGDGTGSMSSHIIFLEALRAWKNAGGRDFIAPRPNAQWMANRWFLQTLASNGKPDWSPNRGAYPHNIWSRAGLSGGGYFSTGFGVATSEDVQAAILWYYNHGGFVAADEKNGTPYDTPSPYPHHSIWSFVNWPVGLQEKNPSGIIPNAVHDSKWGFYLWRSGWTGPQDVVISILTKAAKGNYSCPAESQLSINDAGKKQKWGAIKGFTGDFQPAKDGSTILTTGDGSCLAIDFSRASGADAMLVMTGPGAPAQGAVAAGGTNFSFLFLTKGAAPAPKVEGNGVSVGNQKVSFDGKKIVLGK